jgi:hypothetical protein
MRTFYSGPDAVVTDTHFVWRKPTVQIFAIDELTNVRLVRSGGVRPGLLILLGLALAGAAVATTFEFGPLSAVPPVVAMVIVAVVGIRGKDGNWEIRAIHRRREVRLFTSADPRIFNQVTRALRRSLERRAQRHTYGLAAG